MLPGVILLAFLVCINGAGLVLSIFLMAVSAITLRTVAPSGTTSSSETGIPALAT